MDDFLERRRAAVARAWDLHDEVVLVAAGERVPVPGTDQHYPFRVHPEHRYLADAEVPGSVLAFDPADGWTAFCRVPDRDERIWEGGARVAGEPLENLEVWLRARGGRRFATLGSPLPEIPADAELSTRLRSSLDAQRGVKDAVEVERIRAACAAAAAGFEAALHATLPGVTERRLVYEIEVAFLRAGADRVAFDTVVAGGPNAAVLHFAPTDRVLREGELALVDAGATCGGYASDVTRTYPVGERFSAEQRDLHEVVLAAQRAAIERCRPGREFKEIHLETCVDLARGLADLGLLRGEPSALVERDVHALFFPHGLGHLLGLAVHDAGGMLEGREPSDRFGLRWLRTDLPLEEGHVVTIEPGIYFIPALLDDSERRDLFRDAVDWERVDALRDFGGIRIEDDVLVTDMGPEVLTAAIPKDPER
jgi:Xaa-Pro aminopeptidase